MSAAGAHTIDGVLDGQPPALLMFSLMEGQAPPADVEAVPLCYGCVHLQGANDDGTARCAAFDRIPASIWNGEVDHRAAMRGDRGVRFTAHGGYGQAIETAWLKAKSATVTAAGDEEVQTADTEVIETPEESRPEDRSGITEEAVDGAPPETFHVLAMVEGTPTGDRRQFESGGGSWAQLPITFGWARKDLPAHMEAESVGSLTRALRDGDAIHFWGHHDANGELGAEWYRQLTEVSGGKAEVSVVLDDADVEIDWPEQVPDGEDMLMMEPDLVRFTRYRIRRVDQVMTAAFTETFVEPIAAEEAVVEEQQVEEAAVIAAAIPVDPPHAWFLDPQLPGPTPWTVLDDGQCFGHLAVDGTCHTSFQGTCLTPPDEAEMSYFTTGALVTAEGSRVAVGQITMGTGHADIHLRHGPAVEHYDHTGAAVADVACGRDQFGIWVAGALRPGVNARQVRALRAASLSGDWRKIEDGHGRNYHLVAALAVNVPGYPIPRTQAHVTREGQMSLVAAGVIRCRPCTSPRTAADSVADRIARTIGRDYDARAAALAARVHA